MHFTTFSYDAHSRMQSIKLAPLSLSLPFELHLSGLKSAIKTEETLALLGDMNGHISQFFQPLFHFSRSSEGRLRERTRKGKKSDLSGSEKGHGEIAARFPFLIQRTDIWKCKRDAVVQVMRQEYARDAENR